MYLLSKCQKVASRRKIYLKPRLLLEIQQQYVMNLKNALWSFDYILDMYLRVKKVNGYYLPVYVTINYFRNATIQYFMWIKKSFKICIISAYFFCAHLNLLFHLKSDKTWIKISFSRLINYSLMLVKSRSPKIRTKWKVCKCNTLYIVLSRS